MKTVLEIFEDVEKIIAQHHLTITAKDMERPWGGFFVINENEAAAFAKIFFPEEDFEALKLSAKLSPKILLVAPHKKLSWQYHHRRAEIWCCIKGPVAVATSFTNVEVAPQILKPTHKIKLQQGQRHRLIGLNNWGIVAEIWQHTHANNPSNEDDIVRLQDDFGRQ